MKPAFLIGTVLLAAGIASAGVNMSIAKDQAKRSANTSGQPAAPPAPAAPQPAPTDPVLVATRQSVANLRADFTAICSAADAAAAAEQRIPLLNHLSAAAKGTKASTANVRKLAGDLISALASRKKIASETQKLAAAVHALFNSAHVSATQQEALLNDVQKILTDAEVPTADAAKVMEDLKAIAAETK